MGICCTLRYAFVERIHRASKQVGLKKRPAHPLVVNFRNFSTSCFFEKL
jgi:hypothetical protein